MFHGCACCLSGAQPYHPEARGKVAQRGEIIFLTLPQPPQIFATKATTLRAAVEAFATAAARQSAVITGAALDKERNEKSIAQPATAITERKALTASLDTAYRAVAALLESMDRLVLRFRASAGGSAFAAAWQAARIIRDDGHGTPPPAPLPEHAPAQP